MSAIKTGGAVAGVESIDPKAVKQELLAKYPTKVARKRAKQIIVNKVGEEGAVPEIGANTRTIPGIITQRGCSYAGCKGVVLGPTRDIVNLTHGPIGCGFYSWLTRRNQTKPPTPGDANFMTYLLLHGPPGRGYRLRGRKEAPGSHPGGLQHLSSEGHQHLLHLPRGTHRGRRPRRGQGNEGGTRDQHLRVQLRRLQGRQPVRRTSHREQRHLPARGRAR